MILSLSSLISMLKGCTGMGDLQQAMAHAKLDSWYP